MWDERTSEVWEFGYCPEAGRTHMIDFFWGGAVGSSVLESIKALAPPIL